ncbi:uncharacterized protein LOC143620911 [Bidens hawaiensis]|uniref:uncharacterized protein LOC143620911 n=1 Tax=Bidens hawaiensis TaxID=980011 RepID=UPI00404B8467
MKPEVSGRLAKWAIELGDHTIEYKPRSAFKGQGMVDFITEMASPEREELVSRQSHLGDAEPEILEDQKEPLRNLYTDGASNGDESGHQQRSRIPGPPGRAEDGNKNQGAVIKAHVDSLLVANQVKGEYEAKDPKKVEYLKKTHELLQSLKKAEVIHISQGLDKKADALSKLMSVAFDHLVKDVKVETIKKPSISEDIIASVEMSQPN